MKFIPYFFAACAGAAVAAAVLFVSLPHRDSSSGFSPIQSQAIENIVGKYLDDHPEAVAAALQRLQDRQQAASAALQRSAIAAHAAELLDDPQDLVLGDPHGDVSLVEFFDYRCPYCKRTVAAVMDTLKADGHIRLVLKEFPILGPDSVLATRAALASAKQGKYARFHLALLESNAPLNQDTIMALAKSQGLDLARLRADMQSPAIDALIKKNYGLAEDLKIEGTPAFILGDVLVPGAVDRATLDKLVADARKKG